MTPNLLITALGAIVEIDLAGVSDSDAEAVVEAWRDACTPPSPVVERVDRGETPRTPTVAPPPSVDRATMLERLSQRVTLAAIDARRGDLWMLHAAGVAAEDGRVIVLVGPSGRGKTTAARVLGAHFGYVSDETVAIDDEGRVWPYRKPLSMIVQPGQPKVQRAASDLGLEALPDAALRLGAILLLDRRDDGPSDPVVEEVELGDALEELVPQSSYLTAMSSPLHAIAALTGWVGGIRRVTYRDAASLRAVVDSLLATPTAIGPPRPADAAGVPADSSDGRGDGEALSRPVEPGETTGKRYSRSPVVDALELPDPDRIATLRSGEDGTGTLHVLAGVAPALWRAAAMATMADLRSAAIAEHGHPAADPGPLVTAAVAELVDAGVLEAVDPAWRIRDDVAWLDGGGRVVVLSLADTTATPLALEGSASVIWRALDGSDPLTATQIAERVAAQVGVDVDAVADDVSSFVRDLAAVSLVTAHGTPATAAD